MLPFSWTLLSIFCIIPHLDSWSPGHTWHSQPASSAVVLCSLQRFTGLTRDLTHRWTPLAALHHNLISAWQSHKSATPAASSAWDLQTRASSIFSNVCYLLLSSTSTTAPPRLAQWIAYSNGANTA